MDLAPQPDPARRLPGWAIPLALIVSTIAVYAQTAEFDFINFDDPLYVSQNAPVHLGLTWAGIKSAFTVTVASNWLPVTLLTHMIDVRLYGLDAGFPHLENAALHAASAVLLFLLLRRATGDLWPSAFASFVFALHPLHVESVAWISERKDVLSTFFLFLALYAYVLYSESGRLRAYLAMAAAFSLGLLSKPMLVTFPFLLLLLDVWPLRRAAWPKTLLEKIPLFLLSAISSVIAYRVQRDTGAMAGGVPLDTRVAKALLSYITYLRETVWPAGLAVFYPYPHTIQAFLAIAALAILLLISAAAVFFWRSRPYLATGWFWFLGTLVPVIGLVTVGQQSHADRYMYVPMVGLSIVVGWGAAEIVERWPHWRAPIAAAAVLCCAAFLVLAFEQASYWKNNGTLYVHAIEATGDNWFAEGNLGAYLMGNPESVPDAWAHLEASIRLNPDNPAAENSSGLLLARSGRCNDAIPYFQTALRHKPSLIEAASNLGMCLTQTGDLERAIEVLRPVLRARPNFADAHFNLAMALSQTPGRELEAVAEYEAGLHLNPNQPLAHRQLAGLLQRLGRSAEAASHLDAARRQEEQLP